MYSLLRRLLAFWIRFDNKADAASPTLDPNKPVVYVLRRQSLADSMAADLFLRRQGLPLLPRSDQATGPLVYLELKRRVQRRLKKRQQPTALTRLATQIHEDDTRDYQLVPVSVFWGRTPNKEKSLFKILFSDRWSMPGPVRKFFTVLFNGRATFVEVSAPVSLRELKDEQSVELTSRKAHRLMRVHFNRVRDRVIGPDLSHRRTLLSQIVHSAPVRQAITSHARSKKISLEKARRKAVDDLEEIMADISYPTIRVLDLFLSRLWNRIYNGIQVNNIDAIKAIADKSALVYVPCHRSHIDYLLLSYSLYHQGLSLPHIAAGKNLNMPVVGPILRRGGAFFMRRSFKGDKLYTAVFNEYLHQMFSRGNAVEYFVEGGRSRTGRTLTPKAGMLSMTVRSYARDPSLPMKFVPVYIGYEKVFEANSYLKELRGRKKQSESVFGLLKTVRRLKNYGTVSLNFGEPIDLESLLDDTAPDWRQSAGEQEDRPRWSQPAVQALSDEVAQRINRAAALNPINMIALVLLSSPRNALDLRSLEQQAELCLSLLREVPYSAEITFPPGTPQDWLNQAVNMKVVEKIEQPLGDLYTLDDHHAVLMTYYRNNIIHLLALPSLLCCGLQVHGTVKTRETLHQQLRLIYDYVRNELFMHWDTATMLERADQYLAVLIDRGLVVADGEELHATTEPERLVQFMALSRIMLPTLERYYLTLATLNNQGQSRLTTAELESSAQALAQLVSVLNGLNAPEFFDKALFKRFVQTLREKSVIHTDQDNRLCFDQRIPDGLAAAESVLDPELVRNVRWISAQAISQERPLKKHRRQSRA